MTAVPPEMLARHSHPCVFAIELVQGFEVLKNDLCLRSAQEWRGEIPMREVCIDITEDPWCALRSATDHYSFRGGEIKYRARMRRRIDIAIRNQRQFDLRACCLERGVLRCAAKHVAARAPVNRQRRHTASLSDRRDACRVTPHRIGAGPN